MANTGQPNSGGSQYFITVEPTAWLNGGYSAFGHVTLGSDIVEAISEVPTDANDKPLIDVEIDSIRIMTPQLDDFTPQEDTLYVNAGDPMAFGLICDDENVTYSWYIDDELQQATSFIFTLTLTVNGWHEVKGVISNENYDLPKVWWVEITGGTFASGGLINNNAVLYQNVPNPFNPETTIRFALNSPENVTIDIFNTKGQYIRTLVQADYESGIHSIYWNGTDENSNPVSSGIYFYRLQAGMHSEIRRALLLK